MATVDLAQPAPRAGFMAAGSHLTVPAIISAGASNEKRIVQQLKKEREHTQKQLQRIDEALAALGSSSNGASDDVRSRSQENQPGAEGAMGEDEDSQAEADDVGGSEGRRLRRLRGHGGLR